MTKITGNIILTLLFFISCIGNVQVCLSAEGSCALTESAKDAQQKRIDSVFIRPYCEDLDRKISETLLINNSKYDSYIRRRVIKGQIDYCCPSVRHDCVTHFCADVAIAYYGVNYAFVAAVFMYFKTFLFHQGQEPSVEYTLVGTFFNGQYKFDKVRLIQEFVRQCRQQGAAGFIINTNSLNLHTDERRLLLDIFSHEKDIAII
jgi:hypothetical protein